ncbi:hypothetical protein C8039_20240 [Halogeometricum sp. wsp3]|nr:hypothetical protein C8039_20240 [Halogeometricum sp. wsp3]
MTRETVLSVPAEFADEYPGFVDPHALARTRSEHQPGERCVSSADALLAELKTDQSRKLLL